jgi:hypothetical protein
MADQLSLRGGTTAEHATFTGANKEVTVDTTKKTLVVNDGATVGGHPLMRENASNSALALGSAGTPSLKFTGDTNTGIYSPGADQLAVATNGTGRLFVDASGNVGIGATPLAGHQFTVNGSSLARLALQTAALGQTGSDGFALEMDSNGLYFTNRENIPSIFYTNNAERLRITSAGLVGIGTSSPASLFHLNASASGGGAIFSNQGYNCATVSQVVSSVDAIFGGGVIASDVAQEVKKINADPAHYVKIQTGEGISFHTNITGALGTSVNRTTNERLRITSAGLVGIGSTLAGNANNRTLIRSDSASAISNVLLLNNGPANNNAGQGVRINLSGVSEASSNIRYAYIESATSSINNDHYIAFGTNAASATPVERARIDSSGRLLIGTSSQPYTGGALIVNNGIGIVNNTTNRFATVEHGSGATGSTFTTITISAVVNSASSSVIFETLMTGFSGVYLDNVSAKYSNQATVTMRNNASAGTSATLTVNGGNTLYTLTITTSVSNPVVKVKVTGGGITDSIALPTITFA